MPQPSRRMPLFERLEIESQSNCNRSCWFCPRTYDRSGAYIGADGRATSVHQMPTESVIRLLDEAVSMGFQGLVTFHFYSEPLLDKRNVAFAQAARERGLHPFLHTNGDPLRTNDALSESVQDAYDFIVVGLYDYETLAGYELAQAFWRTRLPRADLRFSYIRPTQDRSVPSLAIPKALVPTDARMSIPDLTYPNGPCSRPLMRMMVRYDGAMANCCEDIHAQFGLGSVYDYSLEELWYSERHERVVRDLLAGDRDAHELCRTCPLTPTGPARAGRKIGLRRRSYAP